MMPVYESPKTETWNQEWQHHPRKIIIAFSRSVCNIGIAKDVERGTFSRQFGTSFPFSGLAAPVYGDFFPRVGHAYRKSERKSPEFALSRALETFCDGYGRKSLNRDRSTVPGHGKLCGARSSKWLDGNRRQQRVSRKKGIPLGQTIGKHKETTQ